MLIQSIHQNSGSFNGDSNLLPLGANRGVQALIRLGEVADYGGDTAIIAQADAFAAAAAGWGLGFRGSVLTAFAVDDVGEGAASYDFATRAEAQGQLVHVAMNYTAGGFLNLYVNGSLVDAFEMGGVRGGSTSVNASVVPWVGAGDAAGANTAGDRFEIVSLATQPSLVLSEAGFKDAVEFGYFQASFSGYDHVWNARPSVLRHPLNFLGANSQEAPVLINEGTTQNAALTVGNLTAINQTQQTVRSLPLRVG